MKFIETHTVDLNQKQAIFNLWNNEYPHQLKFSELSGVDNYLNALSDPTHYFAINENDEIIGWAFIFKRENENWFAMIIDHSEHKKGVGTQLINLLKQKNTILNGWVIDHNNYKKVNDEQYPSPLDFYTKNDFVICRDIRLEIEILSAVKITWHKYPNENT